MPITLKEKANALRRTHILGAAVAVFAVRGFHRSTIKDIARQAGVSDGTIYNYFENKTALLLAALDPMDETGFAGQPQPIVPAGPREFVKHSLKRRFAALTPEMLDLHRVVLSEALVNLEVRELYLTRVLKPAFDLPLTALDSMAASALMGTHEPRFALRALVAGVLGLVMLRLLGDDFTESEWDRHADRLSALMLDGLMTDRSDAR